MKIIKKARPTTTYSSNLASEYKPSFLLSLRKESGVFRHFEEQVNFSALPLCAVYKEGSVYREFRGFTMCREILSSNMARPLLKIRGYSELNVDDVTKIVGGEVSYRSSNEERAPTSDQAAKMKLIEALLVDVDKDPLSRFSTLIPLNMVETLDQALVMTKGLLKEMGVPTRLGAIVFPEFENSGFCHVVINMDKAFRNPLLTNVYTLFLRTFFLAYCSMSTRRAMLALNGSITLQGLASMAEQCKTNSSSVENNFLLIKLILEPVRLHFPTASGNTFEHIGSILSLLISHKIFSLPFYSDDEKVASLLNFKLSTSGLLSHYNNLTGQYFETNPENPTKYSKTGMITFVIGINNLASAMKLNLRPQTYLLKQEGPTAAVSYSAVVMNIFNYITKDL
jgi:hypothetical protein